MKNLIYPCLWFDGQAKQAADFYCNIFDSCKITSENPMVVMFELEGKKIMALNGGPHFKITPAISMFVSCTSNEEIDRYWKKLMEGGSALMELQKYPWSERYGWVKDKFGMTWQLMLSDSQTNQKFTPSFLFSNDQYGNAGKAIHFYTSLFPNSNVNNLILYQEGEEQPVGNLKFGNFTLNGELFAAMDGPGNHQFTFNEGLSLVVECANQKEIDFYWNKLTEGGEESMCGWLKDKFGISWQIVPAGLGKLVNDKVRAPRVMEALMKMKKLEIDVLENA